jgi:hypothetical protein
MFDKRSSPRNWLLLLSVIMLASLWSRAGVSWSETPLRLEAPPAGYDLAGEALHDLDMPGDKPVFTRSVVAEDPDQGPRLWHPPDTGEFPIFLPESWAAGTVHPNRPASTCTVSSTDDNGANTLRKCLDDAVAGDEILFDPVVFLPGSPQTITLATPLPYITVNNLTVDASNAGVVLDGSALADNTVGLRIEGADGTTIRGLQIRDFYPGILLSAGAAYNTVGGDRAVGVGPLGQGNLLSANRGPGVVLQQTGTAHNSIVGNIMGTNVAGDTAYGNGMAGVVIAAGASHNVIGGEHSPGACDGPCNLISGNGRGVHIQDADSNEILGNFIGTDLSGENALGGQSVGVLIYVGSAQNVVGGARSPGACDGPCNLISGHAEIGVAISDDGTDANQVLGNFIGTNLSGSGAVGNGIAGVMIAWGASQNVVGGDHSAGVCDGLCNLISGNWVGVQVQNPGSAGNEVLGNFIGADLSGDFANGNEQAGVAVGWGAAQNVIGGAHGAGVCDGPCNLISGNVNSGVLVTVLGTTGNKLLGNFVGTNSSGDAVLPNQRGVLISQAASDTQVGGAGVGEGNLISGNYGEGIFVIDAGTTGTQVLGNLVGTNAYGAGALPNNYGVAIGLGASSTIVGGAGPGEGNLVSGNTTIGVWIDSPETIGNWVQGNLIGTEMSGVSALPNYIGVVISTGSTGNQVGGSAPGAGNLISGNEFDGLLIQSLVAPGNTIAGNKIGTNLAGTAAVPNYRGIFLDDASDNLIGGTQAGAGNLISGNTDTGLVISGGASNSVQGNTIGADLAGEVAIPNVVNGILIGSGASDNIIGGSGPGAGNLISGNGLAVKVQNEDSLGNQILGNRIGTDRSGVNSLPNDFGVVVILARQTLIGGADTGTPWVCDGPCNLISGNAYNGLQIQGVSPGAAGQRPEGETDRPLAAGQANQVLGNFIGTDLAGTSALPNGNGVILAADADGNLIGGSSLMGEGNLISGNEAYGVIVRQPLTANNQIAGNRIGTTAAGELALPNGINGIWITEGASSNTVGGEGAGLGNLISGHALDKLYLGVNISTYSGSEAKDNKVVGNLIGTNAAGTGAIPNGGGVGVGYLVTGTIIRDNTISGNSLRGIMLMETTGHEVRDNDIGLASNGLSPLPNGEVGILLVKAPQNLIGPGNTAAYNPYGIAIAYPESVGNTITQNRIYANTDGQIVFLEVPQPLAPAPTLTGWDGDAVTGIACSGCQVEVFANADAQPAGRTYLGTATAAGDGSFSLTVGPGHLYLAATATDADGTTSEFSNSLLVGEFVYVYLPLISNLTK